MPAAETHIDKQLPQIKRALLAGLWVIWLALLPAPFAIKLLTNNPVWMRHIWISSFVLSAAAWINRAATKPRELKQFSGLIALGITAGAIADCYGTCLSKYFCIQPLFITAPLFALGHFFYIFGILNAARSLQMTQTKKWSPALLISIATYAAAGFMLWKTLVHSSEALPATHLPLAAYTAVLAAAAAVMLAAAIIDSNFIVIAIGGFLFLASDGLLAVKIFQNNIHHIGDYCWLIYGIGQMLITYGTICTSKSFSK